MFKRKFKVRVTTELIKTQICYIVQYSNFYFDWWVTIKEFFFLTSDYGWWTNRRFSTKESALEYAKDLDKNIFPGMQGGPLMHVIAAKAIAFGEALKPEFKTYAQQVVNNAKILGDVLIDLGLNLVSGGTDSHLLLVDLRSKKVTGKDTTNALEAVNITCNKNGVPGDTTPPTITSGIRLGSPAATSRGFKEKEFTQIGYWITQLIEDLANGKQSGDLAIKEAVRSMCEQFPIYPDTRYS